MTPSFAHAAPRHTPPRRQRCQWEHLSSRGRPRSATADSPPRHFLLPSTRALQKHTRASQEGQKRFATHFLPSASEDASSAFWSKRLSPLPPRLRNTHPKEHLRLFHGRLRVHEPTEAVQPPDKSACRRATHALPSASQGVSPPHNAAPPGESRSPPGASRQEPGWPAAPRPPLEGDIPRAHLVGDLSAHQRPPRLITVLLRLLSPPARPPLTTSASVLPRARRLVPPSPP